MNLPFGCGMKSSIARFAIESFELSMLHHMTEHVVPLYSIVWTVIALEGFHVVFMNFHVILYLSFSNFFLANFALNSWFVLNFMSAKVTKQTERLWTQQTLERSGTSTFEFLFLWCQIISSVAFNFDLATRQNQNKLNWWFFFDVVNDFVEIAFRFALTFSFIWNRFRLKKAFDACLPTI
jgi:hypothetical protein